MAAGRPRRAAGTPAPDDKSPRQIELGRRVRQRRLDSGRSQETLALRAALDRSYIGQIESGRRNPNLDTLCKLARALGCDLADLTNGLQRLRGR